MCLVEFHTRYIGSDAHIHNNICIFNFISTTGTEFNMISQPRRKEVLEWFKFLRDDVQNNFQGNERQFFRFFFFLVTAFWFWVPLWIHRTGLLYKKINLIEVVGDIVSVKICIKCFSSLIQWIYLKLLHLKKKLLKYLSSELTWCKKERQQWWGSHSSIEFHCVR